MTVENVVEELTSLTPIELRQVASIIKDLIDNAEAPSDINTGDLVSFEIRDGCTLTGLVESTTAKRASVLLNAVEGTYTIDLKKVAVMVAAPQTETGDEEE